MLSITVRQCEEWVDHVRLVFDAPTDFRILRQGLIPSGALRSPPAAP